MQGSRGRAEQGSGGILHQKHAVGQSPAVDFGQVQIEQSEREVVDSQIVMVTCSDVLVEIDCSASGRASV